MYDPGDDVITVLRAAGPGGTPAPELSPREWRMLELLASGCSNKKLAQHLSLSMHTVKNELTVLYSKIGVRTRGEAVALMFGAGGAARAGGERP